MAEPMSPERLAEMRQYAATGASASKKWVRQSVGDLLAEVDRLRSDPVRQAAEAWAAAYDEKAVTLAAWQAERLSGITSATPAYDAMNNGYASFKAASVALRAALSGEHPEPPDAYENYVDEIISAGRQVDEQ